MKYKVKNCILECECTTKIGIYFLLTKIFYKDIQIDNKMGLYKNYYCKIIQIFKEISRIESRKRYLTVRRKMVLLVTRLFLREFFTLTYILDAYLRVKSIFDIPFPTVLYFDLPLSKIRLILYIRGTLCKYVESF